jgi:hypothetical protein
VTWALEDTEMNVLLRECKNAIRRFLQTAYTDERLSWLLAHARAEKLFYRSCCCLVGVATAPHALHGETKTYESIHPHYLAAKSLLGAEEAERAYCALGYIGNPWLCVPREALRRTRLIPLVRAEIRRRERTGGFGAATTTLLAEQGHTANR